jgi:hypothetical protein
MKRGSALVPNPPIKSGNFAALNHPSDRNAERNDTDGR